MSELENFEYYRTDNGVLYRGDCLTILPLIEEDVDLVLTDPPYGMNAVKNSGVLKERYDDIIGDENNDVAIKSYNLLKNIKYQVFWGANYYSEILPSSECWIVWDKMNGDSDQTDCELAYTNFRSVARLYKRSTLKTNRVHPTQKPTALIEWIFKKFKIDKDVITIDPFLGSGTTAVACEKLGRRWIGIEISEKYCEIAKQRIKKEYDQFKMF